MSDIQDNGPPDDAPCEDAATDAGADDTAAPPGEDQTTDEDAVLAANAAFYRAFRVADFDAMKRIWSSHSLVACMHPGWPALHGYAQVLASFRAIMKTGTPAVSAHQVCTVMLGDSAFVTCVEHVEQSRLVATNIFTRQGGTWKLVHHQSAPFREPSPSDRPPRDAMLN